MQKNTVSPHKVTGIILAGGESRRFGSDKALFEYNGKKLIEYAIASLRPVCGQILLSTHHTHKYAFTGLTCVADLFPRCGPVAGIHACLRHSTAAHHLIVGCDMPWINTGLFEFLLQNSSGYQVVIPVHKGFKETMASYYHKSCTEILENALQEERYKILDAIAPLKTLFPETDNEVFYSQKLFANINYPKDIE